jgi:hypothetical protein
MYWVHYTKDDKHHYTGPFERFIEADNAAWNIYLDHGVWGLVTTNTQWLERNAELHAVQ